MCPTNFFLRHHYCSWYLWLFVNAFFILNGKLSLRFYSWFSISILLIILTCTVSFLCRLERLLLGSSHSLYCKFLIRFFLFFQYKLWNLIGNMWLPFSVSASSCCWHQVGAHNHPISQWDCWETWGHWRRLDS